MRWVDPVWSSCVNVGPAIARVAAACMISGGAGCGVEQLGWLRAGQCASMRSVGGGWPRPKVSALACGCSLPCARVRRFWRKGSKGKINVKVRGGGAARTVALRR